MAPREDQGYPVRSNYAFAPTRRLRQGPAVWRISPRHALKVSDYLVSTHEIADPVRSPAQMNVDRQLVAAKRRLRKYIREIARKAISPILRTALDRVERPTRKIVPDRDRRHIYRYEGARKRGRRYDFSIRIHVVPFAVLKRHPFGSSVSHPVSRQALADVGVRGGSVDATADDGAARIDRDPHGGVFFNDSWQPPS